MIWKVDLRLKKTLSEQIQAGLQFYQKQFGITPTQCWYPHSLKDEIEKISTQSIVFVETNKLIKGRVWFGFSKKDGPELTASDPNLIQK
jgi:hypothetical protein